MQSRYKLLIYYVLSTINECNEYLLASPTDDCFVVVDD